MASRQELQVQQKREVEKKEEATIPARVFLPITDIYETQDALTVILEMPGVEKDNVDVRVEDGVLKVEGRLDLGFWFAQASVGMRASSVWQPSGLILNPLLVLPCAPASR